MAFPQDVLPLAVEMYLGGSWVDVTATPVYRRGKVHIIRGRADEAAQVDASTCRFEINNRSGNFSPRNPTSAYFGQLGRNTPVRVSTAHGAPHLLVPGGTGDHASTPDSAALSVTGDIDVRLDVRLDDWSGTSQDLVGKWTSTGNQGSWALYLISDGTLTLYWTADGSTLSSATSTKAVPMSGAGRLAVRATLDVNNGASGNTTRFYTADRISGTWVQLGAPVVGGATTSIFNSTSALYVGKIPDFTFTGMIGRVYAMEYRNGIGGAIVADPDFTAQTAGDTSFADTASSPNTWTINSNASLSNLRYRFWGEISALPPRWDTTGTDVYVPVEAAGALRRLTPGSSVLGSALYRGYLFDSSQLVAYWPCEDADGSTSVAPALDHSAMTIIGSPELASFSNFAASHPIPVLNGSEWRGSVPAYTDTGETQVRFLLAVPAAGAEDGQTLVMWYTTGSVRRWEVHYGTGGTLGLRGYDGDGTTLFDTGDLAYAVDGELLLVSVELTQDGADVDYAMATLEPGAATGLATTGTLASNSVGRVGTVVVSPSGGVADVAVGHVAVMADVTTLFDLGEQLEAWAGETAGRRIARLCAEEGLGFQGVGDLDDTPRMGAQRPAALIALIRECADVDAGHLFEPRELLGLGYRTRASLYNQDAGVALDYAGGELTDSLDPVDDDQSTMNDVTVTREGGSSARVVLETGALSVLDPPNGVGRYDHAETINCEFDLQLFDQASWRLHVGTVDEARYPQIAVDLARAALTGDLPLTGDVLDADVGDRVTVDNPPSWMPPEDISQIIQGYAEELGNYEHKMYFHCSPESPYQVAVYGTSRYGPHDTVTNEALDTTETGVDVDTPTGPLWDTTASGFDIMIGGERMTVSTVGAAAGTVQTLTVTRSVNGVVKSHGSGAPVTLFVPSVYAL